MKITRLIADLDALGVELTAENDQLHCRAPQDVLTDALWQQIEERKDEILTFLRCQSTDITPIPSYPRNKHLPLSFSQQRLWFLNQLEGGSATYNEHYAIRLSGPLKVAPLTESITALAHRHEVLRTTFPVQNGEPFQKILPSKAIKLPVIKLPVLSEKEQIVEIKKQSAVETKQPFSLEEGPVWRMKLLQLAKDEYVLLLTIHHIIFDGSSVGLFMRDLWAFYEAYRDEDASASFLLKLKDVLLPPLAIQYADFAIWQRARTEGWERQLHYWREQLAGVPPLLSLPTDHPRPARQSFHGSSQTFNLSQDCVASLKSLSVKSKATLFMTLLAAFKVLLYRYSGTSDLSVGSIITNRVRSEIKPLIGFFANTIVLRTELFGEASFLDVLARVRQVALEAYKHQEVPFEQVVETVRPERSLSHNPLFNVMFVLQNMPSQSGEMAGLTMMPLETEHLAARFDVTLFIDEGQDGTLEGRWQYNTDLFEPETMTRMSGHFKTLLAGLVTDPDKPIAKQPFLTEAEHHQLLVEWNHTTTDYPQDLTIVDLFEAQVIQTPDNIAVISQDQALSYAQLNTQSNQVAHYLQGLRDESDQPMIQPDTLVGLCVERSLEMVIGLLGILKAGAAYVPLDPNYPSQRLQAILEDSYITVLLTQERLQRTLPLFAIQHVVLLDTHSTFANQPSHNLASPIQPDHLAYVLYTSGSTGKPKGVMVEHRNTVALINWVQTTEDPEYFQGTLASTSLNFDLSVYELFATWGFGGTVILVQNALALSRQAIQQYPVTLINTVPSAITELLRTEAIPTSVKVINLAGEPLQHTLAQALYALPHIEAVNNLYGPSEDTTYTTCAQIVPHSNTAPTIGRPIANTRVYILDTQHQPVPIGVPGELCIAGAGQVRGYLNQPQLTAEKFIQIELFGNTERVYKTADLARWLPDGNLDYLGRIDHQIKLRGFRIELGEIEAVLSQHELINEVVVVLHARADNPTLAAYFTASDSTLENTNLRDWLKTHLPNYMIPSSYTVLETFPLMPNGKIDRKALPEPDAPPITEHYVAPQNALERQLVACWQTVLSIDTVGRHDNLFDLGGNSLLVIRLQHELQQQGHHLTLTDFFQYPSIALLAAHLSQTNQPACDTPSPRKTNIDQRQRKARRRQIRHQGN